MDTPDDTDTSDGADDVDGDDADLDATVHTHNLLYHVAWPVAKAPAELDAEIVASLDKVLHRVAGQQGITIQEARITTSYIYLIVKPQPHHSPQQLVTWFKNVSARRFEQVYSDNGETVTWADGHFTGTAENGARAAVRRCLEAQLDDNNTLE